MNALDSVVFDNIEILHQAIYTSAAGKKLLTGHEGKFDGIVVTSSRVPILGNPLYDWLLRANSRVSLYIKKLGFPSGLLASFLKYKTKNTGQYVYNFGQEPRSGSPKSGLPDVLWRHVHRTEMTKIRGVDYFSCDDWVKISTALVEHSAGEMEIISYTDNNNSLKKHSPIQGSLI